MSDIKIRKWLRSIENSLRRVGYSSLILFQSQALFLVNQLCPLSSSATSKCRWGDHAWTHYSRCGLTNAENSKMIICGIVARWILWVAFSTASAIVVTKAGLHLKKIQIACVVCAEWMTSQWPRLFGRERQGRWLFSHECACTKVGWNLCSWLTLPNCFAPHTQDSVNSLTPSGKMHRRHPVRFFVNWMNNRGLMIESCGPPLECPYRTWQGFIHQ